MFIIFGSPQFIFRHSKNVDQVLGKLRFHGHALRDIRDQTDGAELECAQSRYLVGFTILALEVAIHVHAVFAGKEGDLIGETDITKRPVGPHELSGLVLSVRILYWVVLYIRPAEVVHASNMLRISSHGNYPADRFIDRAGGHIVSINLRIGGTKRLGCCKTSCRVQRRSYYRCVAVDITVFSHKRFDYARALHFVVVLPHNPFLGADVGPGEQIAENL